MAAPPLSPEAVLPSPLSSLRNLLVSIPCIMKSRSFLAIVIVACIALLAASVFYLGFGPSSAPTAAVPLKRSIESTEGEMKTVLTPPKTFGGQARVDPADFSSNPKREPEEQRVLDIAAERTLPDEAKVDRLLTLIPSLPPDAQTLAMENAAALIEDQSYLKYRTRLLRLATTKEMRETVMNDSLTRGEELRLPNLLEMMRTSADDAEKKEIREIFEAYLDKDYGPNPALWEAPVRKWVAENTQ